LKKRQTLTGLKGARGERMGVKMSESLVLETKYHERKGRRNTCLMLKGGRCQLADSGQDGEGGNAGWRGGGKKLQKKRGK